MKSVSRAELLREIGSNTVTLVEVLPTEHYHRAHLPGAINIPAGSLAELAPVLLPQKASAIVVYGLNFTWKTAQQAARELLAMGYTNVAEYEEGKQDWVAAGLPLEGAQVDDPLLHLRPSELAGNLTALQQSISAK